MNDRFPVNRPEYSPGFRLLAAALLTVLGFCGSVDAARYYVDFDGGKDVNAGTAPDQAFRHCPGDAAATDAAKAVKLGPADNVVFKGGVIYYGEIAVTASGEKDQPIVFDGNTDGKYGAGRAIIDGSQAVTNWQRLTSAEEAKGNPKWKEIFCAEIPHGGTWENLNLTTNNVPLPVAQEPKMSDPFFQNTVKEFYEAPGRLESAFPGRVYFEKGTMGYSGAPLIGVIAGVPAVVNPVLGGAFTVEMNEAVTLKTVGIKPQPNYPAVKEVEILGDGTSLLKVTLDRQAKEIQKFDLPAPTKVKRLTFKLVSVFEGEKSNWTKIAQVGAWTPEGKNVFDAGDLMTSFTDEKVLTQADPHYYDGMTVSVFGGNDWVFFQDAKKFDPAAHRLYLSYFSDTTYKTTRYSFLNSVKLIGRGGEYCVEPGADKKSCRVYYLPEKLQGGQPATVGYAVRSHGFTLSNASHVAIKGLTIRGQGRGDASGIRAKGGADLAFVDCEITGMSGASALGVDNADGVVVEKCSIHHCGGPDCRGLVLYHCKNASVRFCRIARISRTAVDFYGCQDSECCDNQISDILGLHANGLTFYLGNKNIVVERNTVRRSSQGITIQEAQNVIFRNNLVDEGGAGMCMSIWPTTPLRNVQFLNNTFVRSDAVTIWTAAVFSNNPKPEGLVFRNNIIDGTSGTLPGTYEHNLYTRWGPGQKDHTLGKGEEFEADLNKIFVDPAQGDFHLKPGSPAIGMGMDVGLKEDCESHKIPEGGKPDIGAYQSK